VYSPFEGGKGDVALALAHYQEISVKYLSKINGTFNFGKNIDK